MILRTALVALCLLVPGTALACEANWRFVQVALGAAGLKLSDAPEELGTLAGSACRIARPELTVRGNTKVAARSVTWRLAPRKPQAPTILIDLELKGLTLDAGPDDEMAAHVAQTLGLLRPADLFVTLTWSGSTERLELRTRSSARRPSIWLETKLTGTRAPSAGSWWAGLETAEFSEVSARLRGDGLAERFVLALLALDRLRGEGDPVPRLAALRDLIARDIERLPSGTVDPVSRAALASAFADTPGGRGTLDATVRWPQPQSAARAATGLVAGRTSGRPKISLDYAR